MSIKGNYRYPIVIIAILGLVYTGACLGDVYHGRFTDPLVRHTNRLDFSSLNDLYSLLQTNFDGTLDPTKVLDGAKAGLVSSGGDPYTVYLTSDQAKALTNDLAGKLSGIGAEIGIKNSYLTVVAPVANTPAQAAGLQPGDIIAQINGQDTTGLDVDTAVSKIRGKAGTTVKLKLVRGNQPAFDVSITRADLTVPSVTWSMKNTDIGYIAISTFGTDTSTLIDQAANDLASKGAKKIILDLRNDGGGYLSAAEVVSSEFLPSGKVIVSERTGGKTTDTLTSTGGGKLMGLPLVVLVNGGSASASEITAGALHDNGVAKLIGMQTFGKGSVQQTLPLPGGAELKVTVAHWYTPAGINVNKAGITPDTKVDLTPTDYNASRDPQLDAAIAQLQ